MTSEGTRTPRSLYAAMLLQFSAGGCVMPFIFLLLQDRGLSLGQIGAILTSASASLLVVPFFWGLLADKFLPLDKVFTLLNLIAAGALGFFIAQPTFLGMLAAYMVFFACFNPTLSLINPLCFHHLTDPPRQFGWLRSWGSIGWILPFLPISIYLAKGGDQQLEFVLYIAIALCLAMAALTFWLPHTPPGARRTHRQQSGFAYGEALGLLLRNKNYLMLVLAMFFVSGSYTLLVYYSPPHLENLGLSRAWLGPATAIGVIFEIYLFWIQPRIIRRFTYGATILIGSGALLLRHLLFAMCPNTVVLAFSYVLAGAVIVFFHIGVSVLVDALAQKEVRATAQTLLVLVGQGLGPLTANWVAGIIATHSTGLTPVFYFAAALAGLASVLVAARCYPLSRALAPA